MMKSLIINTFKALEDNEVIYSIIRGWDGDQVIGSDIDILISDIDYEEAGKIFLHFGFKRINRKWYL